MAGSQHHAGVDEHEEIDTRRPFRRADAIAAGIEPRLLRGAMYRRIIRGVYVEADVPDSPQLRAEAALVQIGVKRAFASHATAAKFHGVPVPALPEEHVTVFARGERRRSAEVRVHLAKDAHVIERSGVRVSAYTQMFIELAGMVSFVDLVVVGDNLVRRDLVTPASLLKVCRDSGHPQASRAAHAAGFVREHVDSPMETRLRLLLVLAGLPEPQVNRTLRDVDGEVVRRFDLSYPGVKVIVEYDGRAHIERVEQWESDLERREEIDEGGWRILVVTARGIYRHPEQTVLRVWRLLRARRLPGVPAVPSEAWRAHFPGWD